MDCTLDFINVHNDDMIPLDTYEGVTIYRIDYDSALKREIAFIQKLIQLRKERELQEGNV